MKVVFPDNKAKRKLKAGKAILVAELNFQNPGLAEFLGFLGVDAVMFDGEHGALNDTVIEEYCVACNYVGVTPIIRCPVNDAQMQRYLGLGVSGFHIPQVKSVDMVREATAAIKYPPLGHRGLSGSRATRYSVMLEDWPAYMEKANAETLMLVAIEDREGLAALPEIVKLPEVDVVELGTNDLASDLGLAGQLNHPKVEELAAKFVSIMKASGKPYGIGTTSNSAQLRENYAKGLRWLYTSSQRMLRFAANDLLGALHELQGKD